MYAILIILISYILAFPGYGVLILPQPFLDVHVGRWTMIYVINSKIIPWIGYVIFIHLLYYSFVKPTVSSALIGGVLFFIVSIVLTLFTNLVDLDLRIRIPNYLDSPIYWTAAGVVNSCVELVACVTVIKKRKYYNHSI